MNNTPTKQSHSDSGSRSVMWIVALGIAVGYGFLVALAPGITMAIEVPSASELRRDITERLCDRVAYAGCATSGGEAKENGGDTGDEATGGDTTNDGTDTGDDNDGGGTGSVDNGSSGGGGSHNDGDISAETPGTHEVSITVRTTDVVVVSGVRTLPSRFADAVRITPTDGGDPVEVSAQSALAMLVSLDEDSDTFAITDLQYFPAYESFFLNCITVAGEGELCGSWQYTVNSAYPSAGLDQYTLDEGDSFYVYFGSPRTVTVPETVPVNEPFIAVAKEYDPVTGAYVPVSGYTIGVVQHDPDNPLAPVEVATETVDAHGEATFTLDTPGSYSVGIAEDFYFPTTAFTVTDSTSAPSTADTTGGFGSTGGGGGGSLIYSDEQTTAFDVSGAREFIVDHQGGDGSFSAPIYTDWAAIALAATKQNTDGDAYRAVRKYVLEDTPDFSLVTDFERRAMALMALGVSPYDGTDTNYIRSILSYFDGVQVGDPELVNDDIFALIVLANAGYTNEDNVIQQVVSFVLERQAKNGSWENDVDLTAAAVQALAPFEKVAGVYGALDMAEAYLRLVQEDDGSFGNSFATSWVLQAVAALGDTPEKWSKHGRTPLDALSAMQQTDGGVDIENVPDTTRLWATSYAVPAARGLSWHEVLQSFGRAAGGATAGTSGGGLVTRNAGEHDVAMGGANAVNDTETFGGAEGGTSNTSVSLTQTSIHLTATTPASRQSAVVSSEAVETTTAEEATTTAYTEYVERDINDHVAAAVESEAGGTSMILRMLALLFAAALIAASVFMLRKPQ